MSVSGRNSKRNMRPKTRVNFSAIFVIIIISILAGYLTTTLIVYPLIGERDASMRTRFHEFINRSDGQTEDNVPSEPAEPQGSQGGIQIVEDGLHIQSDDETEDAGDTQTTDTEVSDVVAEVSEPALESGYGIQFGSFSTRAAAESLVADLNGNGIEAEIVERDHRYKVIGTLFSTREEAVSAMGLVNREMYSDVFITER